MKKKHNNVLKWLCMAFILCWGLGAFILLAAEESPARLISAEMFITLKIAAITSLLLCCYVGKLLFNAGLLPDELENL